MPLPSNNVRSVSVFQLEASPSKWKAHMTTGFQAPNEKPVWRWRGVEVGMGGAAVASGLASLTVMNLSNRPV